MYELWIFQMRKLVRGNKIDRKKGLDYEFYAILCFIINMFF